MDAALYALKFIACAGKLQKQEEVNHRVHGGLALPYTHCLHEYIVETGSLAQHYRLTCLPGDATERSGRRTGTHKGRGMHRQTLHTCLVAENTAFGALARRVDGEHRELPAIFEHMQAKRIDGCRFTGAGHSGYAYSA